MLRCIMAECQKYKRTFTKKLIWATPVLTMLLCIVLMAGQYFQNGSYNWWYTMLLPGALSLLCSGVIKKDDNKLHCRAILGLPIDLGKLWIGKIGVCVIYYFISCLVLFVGVTLGSFVFGSSMSFAQSAAGSLFLFITFLWQIPLCLFLADHIGMFATTFINFAGNVVCVIAVADKSYWWIPYAIPSRLMCAVIHVLPNGLPVPENDPLLSTDVILPGICISLILFFTLSLLTALWFRKREAK